MFCPLNSPSRGRSNTIYNPLQSQLYLVIKPTIPSYSVAKIQQKKMKKRLDRGMPIRYNIRIK